MKIQYKISVLYFALSAVVLLGIGTSILYFVSEFKFEDFYKRLETRVNINAQIALFPSEQSEGYQAVRNHFLERLDNERTTIIPVDSLPFTKTNDDVKLLPLRFFKAIQNTKKARYEYDNQFFAGSMFTTNKGEYIVIVSAKNPYGFKELSYLRNIMIVGLLISLLAILLSGKIFSHYIFLPVRNIISKVQGITANNLHERLDENTGKDELSELAKTFNSMLNRLETAFATQNNFVSNASHELRTPLTVISTEAEMLSERADINDEVKTIAETILAETDRLNHILKSLLNLAQSGYDGKKQNWEQVRVDEMLWQVRDSVLKINPRNHIVINLADMPANEQHLCVNGNEKMLKLAISNVVMNACKYSDSRPVQITLSSDNKQIIIRISDHGIGIPEKEIGQVFVPFFRGSNTSKYQGHGIGLPLTLNIIRLHLGTLKVSSRENEGTTILIKLPVFT